MIESIFAWHSRLYSLYGCLLPFEKSNSTLITTTTNLKLHVVQLHSILFPLLSNVFVGMDPLITVCQSENHSSDLIGFVVYRSTAVAPISHLWNNGKKAPSFQKGPLSPANLFLAGYTSTTTKYSEQQPRNFKIQRIGINPIDI